MSYHFYFCYQDDYAAFDEDFQNAFKAKNTAVSDEITKLQSKLKEFELLIGEMKDTEAKVEELGSNRENYISDVDKLKECITKLNQHKEGLLKKLEARKLDAADKQQQLVVLKAEKAKLDAELSKQEVTPLEIQEMQHQRAMLKEKLNNLEESRENVKREIWDLEMKISKKTSAIDKNVQQFNELALDLEMIPIGASNSGGVNLELEVDTSKTNSTEMVNLNLEKMIKPVLSRLLTSSSADVKEQQKRQRESQDARNVSHEKKLEQDDRVNQLQERLNKLVQTMKDEKETSEKEIKERMEQVQNIKRSIAQLNADQRAAMSQSEGEFKQISTTLAQLQTLQAEERKRVTDEVQETCEKVVAAHAHIFAKLKRTKNKTNN